MKPKRKLLAFVLGVGFMLTSIVAQQAKGQVLYGSIVGTVTDQTGAVVPGATVTITNTATGQSRGGTTDAAGVYSIPNLQEGNYDVSVTASGFKSYTQTGVRISVNTVTRINASIQVGAVTESITVEASAAVLQTETSDVKVELNPTAVNNLPLSNYRNYQELVNLVPGATPARFQNAITDTPGRAMTSNINGQNRNSNNTRLDGSANVNIFLPHHTNYVAPAETIETVNIATNNFDAEQGIAGGAAITVTTKSGTNDFHGSAFALHENGAIRAFEWNENRVGLDQKPKSIRNIDGATAGGPIVKNKLFFFAGYEGTFERFSRTGTFSVPATDLRTGDFTRIFGDTVPALFDPYTGDPNGDGSDRTPFSVGGRFNIIPADRLNSATMTMLDLVPDPTDLTKDTNNFFNSGTQAMNRHNIDAKINWNRNEKHQLWFKYSVMDATVRGDFALGAAGGPCLCDGGSGEGLTLVQLATIGQTYTVSPTFLIDAAIGWSRMGQEVRGPDFGTNFGLDVLGIPGTNGPDPRESGMPPMRVDGFTPLGNNEGWSPIFRNDQSYTYNTNASWIKNKHELRFGFDLVHHHLNHWQPELGSGPRGAFNFRRDVTAAGTSGTDFHALASFLIGAPQGVGKSTQFIKQDTFENQFGVYIRDRWRLTPKLTLNLGLRWELYPNKRRSNGIGFESYDFATNEALIGGRGDLPKDLGVTYSKKLFAPRVGFAYQVTDSMVIRSGYGIAYNPMVFSRPLRGFFPFVVASDFVGANGFQPVTTDPNYVDAGIPNASLGPDVGILPICCPDISTGRAPLPLAAFTGFVLPNRQLNRGYIQSWNFILEQKLPGQLVGSIGYVGTASVRGFAFLDLNASQEIGSGNFGRPLFDGNGDGVADDFGRTTTTNMWDGYTHSNYHSLQGSLNRRITGGLYIKAAYTYSKAINMTDDDGWVNPNFQALDLLGRNRALAGFDIPHIFRFAYVYELPFGSGKAWANDGVGNAILGGWQVNGIFSSFQGRPFTVTSSGATLNMPGNLQTADQIKDDAATLGDIFDTPFFDTSAFRAVNQDPDEDNRVRFGNVGRNTLRGPGIVNMDLSLYRTFKLTEKLNLQFRAESFNMSNTPHFNNPNGDANSSNFGKVTSTDRGGTGASTNSPYRQFRFGLRLEW